MTLLDRILVVLPLTWLDAASATPPVCEFAISKGVGRDLPAVWFLQQIKP